MWEQKDADFFSNSKEGPCIEYDKELFDACMRRFLYVRCYDSSEFLATLKVRSSSNYNWLLLLRIRVLPDQTVIHGGVNHVMCKFPLRYS